MSKTAVDAARAGTVFTLPPEDDRLVLVNDKASPLYDERLELPVSEELALSIAREGQIQAGKVRKNGPKLEILDGRQPSRSAGRNCAPRTSASCRRRLSRWAARLRPTGSATSSGTRSRGT